MKDELEFLQMHYYLANNEHSMNARIFNKVESELIKIVHEVSQILELEIVVEVQARDEGGIKSIYKFINKKENRRQLVLVGAFFAGIISNIISDVVADKIKSDPEMERLNKEKIELEIEKLKRDLHKPDYKSDENQISIDPIIQDSIALSISELTKIKISKSKFYKYLLTEGKVDKVSSQGFDHEFKPVSKEKFVHRKDFSLHIIDAVKLDSDYANNVELEIISPVLSKTKLTWRANYYDNRITFTLKDENFRDQIVRKNLQFSIGTKIICDMETKQKLNDDGEIKQYGRMVYNVKKIIYTNGDIVDI